MIKNNFNFLIVEDSMPDLLLIRSILTANLVCQIETVNNGQSALDLLKFKKIDLIFMDIQLEGKLDGIETANIISEQFPQVAIIFMTINSSPEFLKKIAHFVSHGYVSKPIDQKIIMSSIELTYYKHKSFTNEQTESKYLSSLIEVLINTLEMRDPYTVGHQRNVQKISVEIGKLLKLPEKQIEGLKIGALLHDIGKIKIPVQILSNPQRLSVGERTLIQEHPEDGYSILKNVEFVWPIANMARQHHERLDGSGYPFQLEKDNIVDEAKVIAVADVFESMTNNRPYRLSPGVEAAKEELAKNKGVLYDKDVVEACLAAYENNAFAI